MRSDIIHIQIPLSGSVSDPFKVDNALLGTLHCPVITSAGNLYILGSFDTTSANYVRCDKPDGSAVFSWAIGGGSKCIALNDVLAGMGDAKIELDIAQAAVRTLTLIARL